LTSTTRSTRFDHAVILVTDLERAMSDYASLGFTVVPGGVHAGGGTRNALIVFEDGTYIELLTFTRRLIMKALPILASVGLGRILRRGKGPMEERFRARAWGGEGLIDFALLPGSIEGDLNRLRREGVRAEGPIEGGRAGEDEPVRWLSAFPSPPELPFLCSDITDRALRVPEGSAREHPNGAVGIGAITLAVESVETSSARFQAMLGSPPHPAPLDRLSGGRGRLFRLGSTEIIVATSDVRSNPLRRHLRARGEGPFSLRIHTSDPGTLRYLESPRAHGARLELVGLPSQGDA